MKTFDLMISDMSDLIPTLVLHIHDNTKTLPFQLRSIWKQIPMCYKTDNQMAFIIIHIWLIHTQHCEKIDCYLQSINPHKNTQALTIQVLHYIFLWFDLSCIFVSKLMRWVCRSSSVWNLIHVKCISAHLLFQVLILLKIVMFM